MIEKNIRGDFRIAGIAPFDLETVISRLDARPWTPTPLEVGHRNPEP